MENIKTMVVYFSGREPYPFERITVRSDKTYSCCAVYEHYVGAGEEGAIPAKLIQHGKLLVGDLCKYLSSKYAFIKGDKNCKNVIRKR